MTKNLNNNLLILEVSSFNYESSKNENGDIYLEGSFGELGVPNRNKRKYSKSQYLPQIKNIQEEIYPGGKDKGRQSTLLGELDHPKQFETSLNNVSHVIEKLEYNEKTNQIEGKIRLLNTPKGLIAQQLVKDRIPLSISSRAAGSVDEHGNVIMKKLFTYDLVAKPGFKNSQLEVVNESYGIENDNSLFIYEINKNTKINDDKYNKKENTQMINEDILLAEDFKSYSEYTKNKILELENEIKSLKENHNTESTKLDEKTISFLNDMGSKFNKLSKYVHYNAVNLDNTIIHQDHLSEVINENRQIIDDNKNVISYVTENMNTFINEFNESMEVVEKNKHYLKYIAEELDTTQLYAESISEHTNNGLNFSNMLAEEININKQEIKNLNEYQIYLKENYETLIEFNDKTNVTVNAIIESFNDNKTDDKTDDKSDNIKVNEEEENSNSYKNNINEQLDKLLLAAKKQKASQNNTDYNFLDFLNKERKNELMSLNEELRNSVIKKFNETEFKTADDAKVIYESVVRPEVKVLNFIDNMPEKYKEIWTSLNESIKDSIKAQAKYHVLETQYQIDNFWSERDLRLKKFKLEQINENKEEEDKSSNSLNSYLESFKSEMEKRFDK